MGLTGLVFALRAVFRSVFVGHVPLLALVLAILVTAALGGLGPGLLATGLSVAGGATWLLPPIGSPDVESPGDILLLGLLSAVGLVVTALSDRRRRALEASRASERAQRASQRRVEAMIAEREQLLESERAARAALERANRIKDEFLATLSHELRTPLSAIVGWAHILDRPGCTAEQVSRGIEVIRRNARVQLQLIEDLLDVSRIVSGKLRIEARPLDLAPIITAAVESCGAAARAKGIALEVALTPHPAPVHGDPGRLQQVVWNLVSNAIKFTPRGGRVTVSLALRDAGAVLTVRDTGQGIDPDFLPHVFERFLQADSSTTRRHTGLGLGLSIVKHLVDMHGGAVRAESAGLGEGTTFTVELPLEGPSAAGALDARDAARVRACPSTSLRGVSVLVVDDEPDARDLARRFLEDHEATVLTAASGEEALTALEAVKPDVLVSDISMPDMDGYMLLRSIRAAGPERGGGIPALALTAFARAEDRDRALAAGFQAHLPKPIAPEALLLSVARLSGRGAP